MDTNTIQDPFADWGWTPPVEPVLAPATVARWCDECGYERPTIRQEGATFTFCSGHVK